MSFFFSSSQIEIYVMLGKRDDTKEFFGTIGLH